MSKIKFAFPDDIKARVIKVNKFNEFILSTSGGAVVEGVFSDGNTDVSLSCDGFFFGKVDLLELRDLIDALLEVVTK